MATGIAYYSRCSILTRGIHVHAPSHTNTVSVLVEVGIRICFPVLAKSIVNN